MLIFWFLAFAIAWALTVPTALAQLGIIERSPVPLGLGNLIGFAPAIAAFVAAGWSGRAGALLRRTVRFKAPASSYFLAIATPLAWLLGTIALRDKLGASPIDVAISTQLLLFGGVWLILAFGEEIGWRGFALPILNARYGFARAAILLGVVWAIWHYPKLLSSPFVESIEQAAPFILKFTIQIILANVLLCWLVLRSRISVPIGALFHASFNIVATAYPFAAIDLYLTAWVALFAVLVLAVTRRVEVDEAA